MNDNFNLLNKMHEGVIVLNYNSKPPIIDTKNGIEPNQKCTHNILFETDVARSILNNDP